jgi:hypothetical protein
MQRAASLTNSVGVVCWHVSVIPVLILTGAGFLPLSAPAFAVVSTTYLESNTMHRLDAVGIDNAFRFASGQLLLQNEFALRWEYKKAVE